MRVRIEVVSCEGRPPAEALRAEFAAPGGSIGRGEHNDLVLADPERLISRTHAEVRISDHGEIEVHDLGRATAVFVNDEPIGHGLSRRLHGSERLAIGNYTLQLSLLADRPLQPLPLPAVAVPDLAGEAEADPDPEVDPDASVVLAQAELLALADRYGRSNPAPPDPIPLDAVPSPPLPPESAAPLRPQAVASPSLPAAVTASDDTEHALLAEALAAMQRYFAARGPRTPVEQVEAAVMTALRAFAPDQLQRQLLDRVPAAEAATAMARDALLWQLYCRQYAGFAELARQQALRTLEDRRPG